MPTASVPQTDQQKRRSRILLAAAVVVIAVVMYFALPAIFDAGVRKTNPEAAATTP